MCFYISYTKPILHRPLLHIVMKKIAYHRQTVSMLVSTKSVVIQYGVKVKKKKKEKGKKKTI